LLEWSAQQWPVDTPGTLDTLQTRLPAGAARDKLQKIQLALYSKKGYSSVMPALLDELKTLPDDLKKAVQQSSVSLAGDQSTGIAANDDDGLSANGTRLPPL